MSWSIASRLPRPAERQKHQSIHSDDARNSQDLPSAWDAGIDRRRVGRDRDHQWSRVGSAKLSRWSLCHSSSAEPVQFFSAPLVKVAKSCGLFNHPSKRKTCCLEEASICSSNRAPSLDEILEPSKYPRVVVPIDRKSLGLSRGVVDV